MITKLNPTNDCVLTVEVAHANIHPAVEQCNIWFEEKLAIIFH